MYIDFHTHGKLAKYLPFSIPYTNWLLGEAKNAGLDGICLTEHFNTQQFDQVYRYIAEDRIRTERLIKALASRLHKPVVAGSDTHQAVQYGCIRTCFEQECNTFDEIRDEMKKERYHICVHPEAGFKVKTACLLKRSLKEIHALGGDYVSILLKEGGETPAVMEAKKRA